MATKKSVIESHIKSQKHDNRKQRLARKEQWEGNIIEALKKYDQEYHPDGETLPTSTRAYRVKVVTAMLQAGVALNKIDSCFRELLEENGLALTSSTNLRQLLPFILSEEMKLLIKGGNHGQTCINHI